MSIRVRILITAFSCVALALIIAGLGVTDINRYGVLTGRHDRDFENAYLEERMGGLVDEAMAASRGIYASHDLREAKPFDLKLESALRDIRALAGQWRSVGYPADPAALALIEHDATTFVLDREHLDALSRSSLRAADAFGGAEDGRTAVTPIQADLSHFDAGLQTRLSAEDRKLDLFKTRGEHQLLICAVVGAGIVLALIVWQLLITVAQPLHRASKVIVELAEGHLDVVLPEANGSDEISLLWRAIGLLKYRAIEARKAARKALREARRREAEAREILLD